MKLSDLKTNLRRHGLPVTLPPLSEQAFAGMVAQVRAQHPDESPEEMIARALYRHAALSKPPKFPLWIRFIFVILGLIALAVVSLGLAVIAAHAQTVNIDRIGGTKQSGADVIDTSNFAIKVNCVVGCSGGGVGGNVTVLNFPASQPVTGTFWQTTQPVSGTFWQATQPVSGSVSILNFPASVAVTGTFFQATQPVSIASMPTTPVTGTFFQSTQPVSSTQLPAALDGSGFFKVHEQGTVPVTGTFFQATQPISGSVSVSNFPATQPVSGTVAATQSGTWTVQPGNTANTTAWKVDGSAVTQPVSGTVSANASQTGTWTVQPGNTANTTAWKVDGSAVTQPVSGSVSVSNFPASQAVTGTFFQGTQPVSLASMPSTPVTNANLDVALSTRTKPADQQHALLDSGSTTAVTSSLPTAGVFPVIVVSGSPVLSQRAMGNQLLYQSAMKTYCYQNLNGCAPSTGGLR